MKYRIYASRFDITEEVYSEFNASNDEDAIKKYKEIVDKTANAWDNMRMVAVEIVEKTRLVIHSER